MPRPAGTAKTGGRQAGTPNKVTHPIREAAQEYTLDALETLVAIMRDPESPPAARVSACNSILDRGHGKPTQAIDLNTAAKHEEWLDLLEGVKDVD